MTPAAIALRQRYDELAARISAGEEHLSAVTVAEVACHLTAHLGLPPEHMWGETGEVLESLCRRIAAVIQAGPIGQGSVCYEWGDTVAGGFEAFIRTAAQRHNAWRHGALEAVDLDWLCTMLAPGSPLPAAAPEPYGPDNPRFVWVIGAIREQFPDIPPSCEGGGGVTLWDRKHRTEVIILDGRYAQAMALETTRQPGDAPFTQLADWLNRLSPEVLASENLPV